MSVPVDIYASARDSMYSLTKPEEKFTAAQGGFSMPAARKKKSSSNSIYAAGLLVIILVSAAIVLGLHFTDTIKLHEILKTSEPTTVIDKGPSLPEVPTTKDVIPIVPGLLHAGLTVDALYGTKTDRSAISMDTFNRGQTFADNVSGKLYSIPDSVQNVHRVSACSSDISVNEYKNTQDYTKAYTVGMNVGYGAFTLGPELTWSTSKMTEHNGNLFEAKLECVAYKASLRTDTALLTPDFVSAVKNRLPNDENDWQSFLDFVSIWGTHYYDTVDLGGVMQSNVIFSEEYTSNKTSYGMQVVAKAALGASGTTTPPAADGGSSDGGSSGSATPSISLSFGYNDDDVKEARENEKGTKQFHRGGNPSVFFKSGYEAWVGTIDSNPDVVSFRLSSLAKLVNMVDPLKAKIFEKSVEKYLNYVGNMYNPAHTCNEIKTVAEQSNYRDFDEGVFYVKAGAAVIPTLCNFDVGLGGWMLTVNKLGGWQGEFKPTNAWLMTTGINSLRPSLVSNYKMLHLGSLNVTRFMLQKNTKAQMGARIRGSFLRGSKWQVGPENEYGSVGMRRRLSPGGLYLVLSEDGGICLTKPYSGSGFNCDGSDGQCRGIGLFDKSAADEFSNCDDFSWKSSFGGEEPSKYYSRCFHSGRLASENCRATGGYPESKNCCMWGAADEEERCSSRKIPSLYGHAEAPLCKCTCLKPRSQVNECGPEVGFVSLWMR